MDNFKIKLTKSIQSFGNEITEIEFKREPIANDMAKHGSVYSVNQADGSVTPLSRPIMLIAEDCAGLSRGSLGNCSLSDFSLISAWVINFLADKG